MEHNTKQEAPYPMADLAKDIARQRSLIEDNSRLMCDDIDSYIRSYFERTGNDDISFAKNPFKNKWGGTITEIYLTKDNKILVNGYACDTELSKLNPIDQALLFEHIVKILEHTFVYVVLEERFDPTDGTTTKILGTFKHIEDAQNRLENAVKDARSIYPEIWEQYQNEGRINRVSHKNEYDICTSEYYYNVKVVEQSIE